MIHSPPRSEKLGEYIDLLPYLARVAQSIREDGWISRSEARRNGTMATADYAHGRLILGMDGTGRLPTNEDAATAVDALAFIRQGGSGSEFDQTICDLIRQRDVVSVAQLGYAASIVYRYQMYLQGCASAQERITLHRAHSIYQGDVGALLTRDVVVLRRVLAPDAPSPHILTIMEDISVNVYVYFDPKLDHPSPLAEGGHYTMTGIVRRHETVRGVPETIVTGCSFRVAILEFA